MMEAISEHYGESRWKQPSLGAIIEKFKMKFDTRKREEVIAAESHDWDAIGRQCEEDHRQRIKYLCSLDPKRLAECADYLRAKYRMKLGNNDPREWSRLATGFAVSVIERGISLTNQTQPLQPHHLLHPSERDDHEGRRALPT
jgi:hypothetical protein